MVAKNLSKNIAKSDSFQPFRTGTQGRKLGTLRIVGSALALALLLGTSSLSQADSMGGVLGGI